MTQVVSSPVLRLASPPPLPLSGSNLPPLPLSGSVADHLGLPQKAYPGSIAYSSHQGTPVSTVCSTPVSSFASVDAHSSSKDSRKFRSYSAADQPWAPLFLDAPTFSETFVASSPKVGSASPTMQPGSPKFVQSERLELIRNGNVRFDDWRLPDLMQGVSELSVLEFGEDIIQARHLSMYHKMGGSLDLLASQPGNICAGFCYYKPEPTDPDHTLQIMFLAVRKEFQKHGCGRLLVSLAVNNAKNGPHIHRVRLMAAEKAIPFYETIGFVKEEKDEDDYSNWMEDLLYSNSSSVWMEFKTQGPGSPVASPKSPDINQGFVFEERTLVYNAFGLPSSQWARSPPSSPVGGMPLPQPTWTDTFASGTPVNGSTGWAPLFSDNFVLCEAETPTYSSAPNPGPSPFGSILNDLKLPSTLEDSDSEEVQHTMVIPKDLEVRSDN